MDWIKEDELAHKLANESPNLNKGSHPYELSDNKAVEKAAGADTPGVGGSDWDKTDEEKDEDSEFGNIAELTARNRPLANSEPHKRKDSASKVLGRGGGSSQIGDILDTGTGAMGAVDPEAIHLTREAFKEGSNGNIGVWLEADDNDQGESSQSRKRLSVKLLNLEEIDPKNDLFVQRKKIEKIWDDPDATVTLEYGKDRSGEQDRLVFKSLRLGTPVEPYGSVSVRTRHLNRILEQQGIRFLIHEPRNEQDTQAVLEPLHLLRVSLKKGTFQGNKLFVERYPKWGPAKEVPERSRDSHAFNLRLQKEKLNALSKDIADSAKYFLGVWKHHDRDKILSLDFVVEGRELSNLKIRYMDKEGNEDSVEISAKTFSEICEGVRPFTGDKEEFVGLKFGTDKGQWILPQTSEDQIKKIASRISIDGIRLDGVQINKVLVEEKRANVGTMTIKSPNLSVNEEAFGLKGERVQRELYNFVNIWKSGKVFEITLGVKGADLLYVEIEQEGGTKSASVAIGDLCDALGVEKIEGGIKFGPQLSITGTDKNTGTAKYVLGKLKIEGNPLNSTFITNFIEL